MPLLIENPEPASPSAPVQPRRSFVKKIVHGTGWLVAAPLTWLEPHRIKRGWSLVGKLFELLTAARAADERFKTMDGGVFDLRATAFSYGLTVPELEARLAARRLQTARVAYVSFALGWLFLIGWIWHALSSPLTLTRVMSALGFLPFWVLFLLTALYNALLNFQLRTGRLASWRDYLATTERFWPH